MYTVQAYWKQLWQSAFFLFISGGQIAKLEYEKFSQLCTGLYWLY